jgi:uncharacterized membrane protein YbhN (UPF0104 family)
MAPTLVSKSARRGAAVRGLAQIVATLAVLVYLLFNIDAGAFAQSVRAIPTQALFASLGLLYAAVMIGFFRWIVLLQAYGAQRMPPLLEAARVFCGALFYNLLPGAVGGDLYRAYATRHCFDDGAIARSGSVVFVDRVLGFTGLLLLVGAASLFGSSGGAQVLLYSGFGLCGALGAVIVVSTGRHFARWLPGPVARIVQTLPAIVRPAPFALAILISLVTQVMMAVAGHCLISSLAPPVTLFDSMATFPLGTLAAYFPLAVAGGGARDMVLVVLFAKLGVPRESALATSLCLLASNVLIGVSAGLLQSRFSIALPAPPEAGKSDA